MCQYNVNTRQGKTMCCTWASIGWRAYLHCSFSIRFLCLTEQLQWLSVCNLLHRLVIHLDKRWTYSKGQQREKGEILHFQKGWRSGIIPQLSLISWTALHGIASDPKNGEQRFSWGSKHKYLRVLKKDCACNLTTKWPKTFHTKTHNYTEANRSTICFSSWHTNVNDNCCAWLIFPCLPDAAKAVQMQARAEKRKNSTLMVGGGMKTNKAVRTARAQKWH